MCSRNRYFHLWDMGLHQAAGTWAIIRDCKPPGGRTLFFHFLTVLLRYAYHPANCPYSSTQLYMPLTAPPRHKHTHLSPNFLTRDPL